MPITPTNVVNSPAYAQQGAMQPPHSSGFIAGELQINTDNVTIVSGSGVLVPGTVLGRITASGKYKPCTTAAVDGSQTPLAILADAVDATSADVKTGAYFAGRFWANRLTLGAGWTIATMKAALGQTPISLRSTDDLDLSLTPAAIGG